MSGRHRGSSPSAVATCRCVSAPTDWAAHSAQITKPLSAIRTIAQNGDQGSHRKFASMARPASPTPTTHAQVAPRSRAKRTNQ
jgi:hypothetical protein